MPSPSARVTPSKCEFTEGSKRCRRNGVGSPPLCEPHRTALESLGYHMPRPGIGEQLGGMFDQVLHGRKPSPIQVEQMVADIAGSLLGRQVTVEEVGQVRRGDYSGLRQAAEQFQRDRAHARAQMPHGAGGVVDPTLMQKIEHAKACGRARAVLGFTKNDILTAQILKTRHRELAKQHHPDRPGGSTEKMQRINQAIDLLAKSL